MKKLITVIMIICIILCGCGKEEAKAPDTPTIKPTEITSEKFQAKCDICGEKGECQEIKYKEKTYYACTYCYEDTLAQITDYQDYESLFSAINIVAKSDNETIMDIITKSIDGTYKISITKDGVVHANESEVLDNKLKEVLGNDYKQNIKARYRKVNAYTIEINKFFVIVPKVRPTNPLEPDEIFPTVVEDPYNKETDWDDIAKKINDALKE